MSVQAISSNPFYVDLVKSTSLDGVHKISSENFSRDFKSGQRDQTADKKNAAVSENKNAETNINNLNHKYLPLSPVNSSSITTKLFLEAKKTNTTEYQTDPETAVNDSITEITDSNGSVIGTGSYIVINEPALTPERKVLSSGGRKWKERIDQIYHVGFRKEPGTLVNATA